MAETVTLIHIPFFQYRIEMLDYCRVSLNIELVAAEQMEIELLLLFVSKYAGIVSQI